MNWDAYIDQLLDQSKDSRGNIHISKAAIVAVDDGKTLSSDSHTKALLVHDNQYAIIADCFKNKNFSVLENHGICLGDNKYLFLREEDGNFVVGKHKEIGFCSIHASKTALVIAVGTPDKQQGNASKAVGVIADQLIELDH